LSLAPITLLVNQAVTLAKKKFKIIIPTMIATAAVNPYPK